MPSVSESSTRTEELTAEQDTPFERLVQNNFDPVRYLNDVLPQLTLNVQSTSTPRPNRAAALQNASAETQKFMSKLSTHNARASSELSALTDEILRSGNRLAYEVEVLRGDTNSLYDLLTDTLKDDIAQFVITTTANEATRIETSASEVDGAQITQSMEDGNVNRRDPEFIRQLQLLGLIKTRLEAVITLFGEAMKWPIAPSEVSVSSLISVSAPDLGVVNPADDDKARAYTQQLRIEITELLESDGGGYAGLEAAIRRVNDLKRLVQVWKDTSEEKVRIRLVESLTKPVEDKKKALDARSTSNRPSTNGSSNGSGSMPGKAGRVVESSTNTAAGLFRKLRDEIYLE